MADHKDKTCPVCRTVHIRIQHVIDIQPDRDEVNFKCCFPDFCYAMICLMHIIGFFLELGGNSLICAAHVLYAGLTVNCLKQNSGTHADTSCLLWGMWIQSCALFGGSLLFVMSEVGRQSSWIIFCVSMVAGSVRAVVDSYKLLMRFIEN